jgi:hypothetical protein
VIVGHPADRGFLPGHAVEGVEQCGLVPADRQQVVGIAVVQVGGVFALGVHPVGQHHHVRQILDLVQRRREHGDLVRLGPDIGLGDGDPVRSQIHAQPVTGLGIAVPAAALGLAVHRRRHQLGVITVLVVQITELRGPVPGEGRVHLGHVQLGQHGVAMGSDIPAGAWMTPCSHLGQDVLRSGSIQCRTAAKFSAPATMAAWTSEKIVTSECRRPRASRGSRICAHTCRKSGTDPPAGGAPSWPSAAIRPVAVRTVDMTDCTDNEAPAERS